MYKQFICDLKSLSSLQIHYRLNMFCKKAVWIHYKFTELTMNLLSASRIHSIFFLNALWTHNLHFEFIMNRLFLREFIMNQLSSSWMCYRSTMKTWYVSQLHNRSIICISKTLWINDLFHKFTIDTIPFLRVRLFFSQNHYKSLSVS